MIDVDHNIKARLQWIKTVDSHEFGKSVLNTIMGEIKLCLIPTRLLELKRTFILILKIVCSCSQ